MKEYDRLSMVFHLHSALKCIADGRHELAAHNVEQAVEILNRSEKDE